MKKYIGRVRVVVALAPFIGARTRPLSRATATARALAQHHGTGGLPERWYRQYGSARTPPVQVAFATAPHRPGSSSRAGTVWFQINLRE